MPMLNNRFSSSLAGLKSDPLCKVAIELPLSVAGCEFCLGSG